MPLDVIPYAGVMVEADEIHTSSEVAIPVGCTHVFAELTGNAWNLAAEVEIATEYSNNGTDWIRHGTIKTNKAALDNHRCSVGMMFDPPNNNANLKFRTKIKPTGHSIVLAGNIKAQY